MTPEFQSGVYGRAMVKKKEGSGLMAARLSRRNEDNSAGTQVQSIPTYHYTQNSAQSTNPPTNSKAERAVPKPEKIDYKKFEEKLEQEFKEEDVHSEEQQRKSAIIRRITQIALIIGCLYLAFLIYGAAITNYSYNSKGQIQAEILSVSELSALDEYKMLRSYYLRARNLYEEALTLDYELSVSPDKALILAMDYTEMLDTVAKLTVDINAATFNTSYTQIKAQLLNWVKTDIAVYLQNVAAAISTNNAEKANNAVYSREVMYSDFMQLTKNMAIIGDTIRGAQNADIYQWSPEKYIAEKYPVQEEVLVP